MKRSILIHHHATFKNIDNNFFTRSFIAHWVNELSIYFEVGLLLHKSRNENIKNDTKILKNIKVHSLGIEGNRWDRIQRIKRIKRITSNISKNYDILLIRGITPRQLTIYNNSYTKFKFYLLVGSIKDSMPQFNKIFNSPYSYFMYFVRILEFLYISKGSHIFANSKSIVDELKSILKIDNASFVPTNTISKKITFSKPKSFDKKKCFQILFCGRVELDKGIFELLTAFSKLKSDFYTFNLIIVGQYNKKVINTIKSKSYWKFIQSRVVFKGFINFGSQLFDIYRNSDIFILPTYHEGFPHVIWEAAAFDLPIITTNVGGIKGVLTDNHVELINPKSSEDIINAINNVVNNKDLVAQRKLAIKELLKDNTLEKSVEKLYFLINKKIEGK